MAQFWPGHSSPDGSRWTSANRGPGQLPEIANKPRRSNCFRLVVHRIPSSFSPTRLYQSTLQHRASDGRGALVISAEHGRRNRCSKAATSIVRSRLLVSVVAAGTSTEMLESDGPDDHPRSFDRRLHDFPLGERSAPRLVSLCCPSHWRPVQTGHIYTPDRPSPNGPEIDLGGDPSA